MPKKNYYSTMSNDKSQNTAGVPINTLREGNNKFTLSGVKTIFQVLNGKIVNVSVEEKVKVNFFI